MRSPLNRYAGYASRVNCQSVGGCDNYKCCKERHQSGALLELTEYDEILTT